MKRTELNRWSPLLLKNGKQLRNRVVVPPMASQTATSAGFVTDQTLEHYERLSEADAGLLIVEYTFVHPTGRSEENQLAISSDLHVSGLRNLAALIKKSGALAGIQFSHGGGKTERGLTGGVIMGPSAIPVPVKDRVMDVPSPMNIQEIELWKKAFVDAADRAVRAGFDLIELHSAHGYGLNQWLSPITNQRQDAFGKGRLGRMRLLSEIVTEIRLRHPKLLISVRMPGVDFIEGGIEIIDSILIAQTLEKLGVDFIHVSSGVGGWRRPRDRSGEGYLVNEAAQIQAKVNLPVIGVGGIQSGDYIDAALMKGKLSLAAVGRAILENPKGWRAKVMLQESADSGNERLLPTITAQAKKEMNWT